MSREISRREFCQLIIKIAGAVALTNGHTAEAAEMRNVVFDLGIYSNPKDYGDVCSELKKDGINLVFPDVDPTLAFNRQHCLNAFHQKVYEFPGIVDIGGHSKGGGLVQMYGDAYSPIWQGQSKIRNAFLIAARDLYCYDPLQNLGTEEEVPIELRDFYRLIDRPDRFRNKIGGEIIIAYGSKDTKIRPYVAKGLAARFGVNPFELDSNHDQIVNKDNLTRILRQAI